MADNITALANTGSGTDVLATDEIGGVHYPRTKVGHGPDGSYVDASAADPLPVMAYGELVEAIEALRIAVQALTRSGLGLTMPDTAARLRVAIGNIEPSLTLGTVGTVSSVTTLQNQTAIGGVIATEHIPSLMRLGADSMRRNISVTP